MGRLLPTTTFHGVRDSATHRHVLLVRTGYDYTCLYIYVQVRHIADSFLGDILKEVDDVLCMYGCVGMLVHGEHHISYSAYIYIYIYISSKDLAEQV